MSGYLLQRSENHEVKHLFGGKNHFFEVKSKSGEKYTVQIKVGCDCRYMGVQGVANSKICSHILAVFKEVVKNGQIERK